jgi:predicted nucleic acid-binding protein
MKVVSDASPLINLSRIGRLALLPEPYQHVAVPEAFSIHELCTIAAHNTAHLEQPA